MKATIPTLALCVAASSAEAAELIRATPGWAVSNSYIITLKDGVAAKYGGRTDTSAVPLLAADIAALHHGRVQFTYEVIDGFALHVSDAEAARLARDPRVARVEQDQRVTLDAIQPAPPSYGIDRIDQRTLPLSSGYAFDFTGRGVHAYIIDTGVRTTHREFAGRMGNGISFVDDGNGLEDCFNHGTHVAGILGGTTFGVAKGVIIHPVRVIGCAGDGTIAQVIAGVDWVMRNHIKPAVANMSLGDPVTPSLDAAVEASIRAGITYAVSAGNDRFDACNKSPARVPAALTIGASTSTDNKAFFSNFGPCVDLYAPGHRIRSASNASDTASILFDGTSMAAPHAAGTAALYLEQFGDQSPAIVHAAVVRNATVGVMSGLTPGTANRVLHSRFGGGATATVFADDFEVARGWTVNASGTDTATSGQWTRGDPEPSGLRSNIVQLGTTVSGANDLVTGRLAGATTGSNDLDGGVSSIASRAITLPPSGTLTLSFFYYFVRPGGDSSETDFFRLRVVRPTGATTVFQLGRFQANEIAAWQSGYVNLGPFAGQTVRLLIEAVDAGTSDLVEAAVDNVTISHTP
jgi:subtilisin family serine protease